MPMTTTLQHHHTILLTSDDPEGAFSRDEIADLLREIDRLGLRDTRICLGIGEMTCTGIKDATCLTAPPVPGQRAEPVNRPMQEDQPNT